MNFQEKGVPKETRSGSQIWAMFFWFLLCSFRFQNWLLLFVGESFSTRFCKAMGVLYN